MKSASKIYNVTLEGQSFKLRFVPEESPTKQGVKLQFVMENEPENKQALADKISVALQKKFGDAGVAITYNDREAYKNVISFIVPMDSIAKMLVNIIKG
jgi:hypothetical protein